jgi:hypothetical protein
MSAVIEPELREHYLAVGRVTVHCTRLETVAGSVAHIALGADSPVDDWIYMNAITGRAMRELELAVSRRPEDSELSAFLADCQEQIASRNRLVHDLITLGYGDEIVEGFEMHNARDGSTRPLPHPEEIHRILHRMGGLMRRGLAIERRISSERQRREPTPGG